MKCVRNKSLHGTEREFDASEITQKTRTSLFANVTLSVHGRKVVYVLLTMASLFLFSVFASFFRYRCRLYVQTSSVFSLAICIENTGWCLLSHDQPGLFDLLNPIKYDDDLTYKHVHWANWKWFNDLLLSLSIFCYLLLPRYTGTHIKNNTKSTNIIIVYCSCKYNLFYLYTLIYFVCVQTFFFVTLSVKSKMTWSDLNLNNSLTQNISPWNVSGTSDFKFQTDLLSTLWFWSTELYKSKQIRQTGNS